MGVGGGGHAPAPAGRGGVIGPPAAAPQIEEKAADLQTAISEGATSFLFTEYKYVGIFMVRAACGCRGRLPGAALLWVSRGEHWKCCRAQLAGAAGARRGFAAVLTTLAQSAAGMQGPDSDAYINPGALDLKPINLWHVALRAGCRPCMSLQFDVQQNRDTKARGARVAELLPQHEGTIGHWSGRLA